MTRGEKTYVQKNAQWRYWLFWQPFFSRGAPLSGVYLVRVKAGGRMIEFKPVLVSH